MLPPPPPPQAPDSRPPSPLPPRSPSPGQRERSVSRPRYEEGLGSMRMDGDAGDADMPTIAINALKGVRAANVELAEERRRAQSLLAQLNALSTTHESLKADHTATSSAIQELSLVKKTLAVAKQETAKLTQELSLTKQELSDAREEVAVTKEE
ncbi:hypothetical protein C0991_008484, partial [Blastosporella zonata]